jgi:hypothetical protein
MDVLADWLAKDSHAAHRRIFAIPVLTGRIRTFASKDGKD